ncbi:MAG: transcription antitermination factor NusB [Eubacteriales bacterium]|jgi:N utilization substance protein B
MSRFFAREAAFLVVFEHDFNPEKSARELMDLCYANEELEDFSREKEYFEDVVQGVFDRQSELDEIIETHSLQWKKSRLSRTAVAMLRVALYEILYRPDIDVKVSVNEAVEILKKYDMDEAAKYANGVLGGFLRTQQPAVEEE